MHSSGDRNTDRMTWTWRLTYLADKNRQKKNSNPQLTRLSHTHPPNTSTLIVVRLRQILVVAYNPPTVLLLERWRTSLFLIHHRSECFVHYGAVPCRTGSRGGDGGGGGIRAGQTRAVHRASI